MLTVTFDAADAVVAADAVDTATAVDAVDAVTAVDAANADDTADTDVSTGLAAVEVDGNGTSTRRGADTGIDSCTMTWPGLAAASGCSFTSATSFLSSEISRNASSSIFTTVEDGDVLFVRSVSSSFC